MKKKVLILFSLLIMLIIALGATSVCYAEDELPIAQETSVEEEVEQPIGNEVVAEEAPAVQEVQETETSDNNALVWIKETWEKVKHVVLGFISGITISSIVSAVFYVVIKRLTNKGFDAIKKQTDTAVIADLVSQKVLHNMANVKITAEMKPMVESQVRAICEEITAYYQKEAVLQAERNLALIDCFEKLGNFYKGSIAVSDEQKEALDNSIAKARALYNGVFANEVSAVIEIKEDAKEKTKVSITENY